MTTSELYSRPLRLADPAFSRNPKPPALAGGVFTTKPAVIVLDNGPIHTSKAALAALLTLQTREQVEQKRGVSLM